VSFLLCLVWGFISLSLGCLSFLFFFFFHSGNPLCLQLWCFCILIMHHHLFVFSPHCQLLSTVPSQCLDFKLNLSLSEAASSFSPDMTSPCTLPYLSQDHPSPPSGKPETLKLPLIPHLPDPVTCHNALFLRPISSVFIIRLQWSQLLLSWFLFSLYHPMWSCTNYLRTQLSSQHFLTAKL
jgi:hypothetical protein